MLATFTTRMLFQHVPLSTFWVILPSDHEVGHGTSQDNIHVRGEDGPDGEHVHATGWSIL